MGSAAGNSEINKITYESTLVAVPSLFAHDLDWSVGQASADGNAATDEAKSGSLIGADSVSMPRRSSTMTETMTPLKADCVKDMAQQLESEVRGCPAFTRHGCQPCMSDLATSSLTMQKIVTLLQCETVSPWMRS